jgi:hypoxanthine phosphoribosyltransferase
LQAFSRPTPSVQAQKANDAFAVDPGRLGLVSGGGKPLPEAVRGTMEAALGADFSTVRVHVAPQAERIGAVAFTIGADIYFAPGRFQPDTVQGQQLLGHELAHVVQQRQGRVRNPLAAGVAVVQDRALEAEADRLGMRAAIGRTRPPAALQPSSGVLRPGPASAPRGSAVQPLRYARFQGTGWLTNWFSSGEETELDKLEVQAAASIDGCRRFVDSNVHRSSSLHGEVRRLEDRLTALRSRDVQTAELAAVKRLLQALFRDADHLSVRLAQMLVIQEDFSGPQRPVPGQAGAALPGRPDDLARQIASVAAAARITDVGELRELLDFASQWISDTLLKVDERTQGVLLALALEAKKQVAVAAQRAHQAYYLAVLHYDEPGANAAYQDACVRTSLLNLGPLVQAALALPKPREDRTTSFDPGAIAIAGALIQDGFIPDLLIGLPTGGTHAANRLAAALAIAGHPATVWHTRLTGVKQESKALVQGVSAKSMLRGTELEHLRSRLLPAVSRAKISRRPIRVVAVDDGAVTGDTLVLTRDRYEADLTLVLDCDVEVRTATVKGGGTVEHDKLYPVSRPAPVTNPIDYVYNFTADRAGPRQELVRRPLEDRDLRAATQTGSRFRSTVAVTIHSTNADATRTVPLNRVLLAKLKRRP